MDELSKVSTNALYVEVLQHSHQCVSYSKQFQGRQDIINTVKDYILNTENCHPFIIHGESGCGKTSVLAQVASLARDWIGVSESTIIVTRFLGTSTLSSSIRKTLISVCEQLQIIYPDLLQAPNKIADTDQFSDIVNTFYNYLTEVGKLGGKVLLILDSLDQLNGSDSAYHVTWLKSQLPNNVKMILSTLTDMHDILASCQLILSFDCFLKIPFLEPEVCEDIVRFLLSSNQRDLADWQWKILQDAFHKCSSPIFVNLVFNQVINWKSWTAKDDAVLESTVHGAITALFNRLMKKYGTVLVSHALAYITASRNGLSEAEVEDLLSLDEEVLQEVFSHHLPPVIRIPPLCWTRIRQELGAYLTEREADEVQVLFWYHRLFVEVARKQFLADYATSDVFHSHLADYFLGTWGNGNPKPFTCPPKLAEKLKRSNKPPPEQADRLVPDQPLIFSVQNGKVCYNLRKLNELPFHLCKSGRYDEFEDEVSYNIDFLSAKLVAFSVQDILQDFDFYLSPECMNPNQSFASHIRSAIQISVTSLNHSHLSLPVNLAARLLDSSYLNIKYQRLINECMTKSHGTDILPLNACFNSGNDFIHCSLHLQSGEHSLLCDNGQICCLNPVKQQVIWFDINGNMVKSIVLENNLETNNILYQSSLSQNGFYLHLQNQENLTELFRTNLLTGKSTKIVKIENKYDKLITAFSNYTILASSLTNETEFLQPFCLLKAEEPLRFLYFFCKSDKLICLINDELLIYLGTESSEFEHVCDNYNNVALHVVFLKSFDKFTVDLNTFLTDDLSLWTPSLTAVLGSVVLVLNKIVKGELTIKLFHFVVDLNRKVVTKRHSHDMVLTNIQTKHCIDIVTLASKNCKMFAILLPQRYDFDKDTSTFGFTWKPSKVDNANMLFGFNSQVKISPTTCLQYQAIQENSYPIQSNFSKNSGYITDDGNLLIVKGCKQFCFNVWNCNDGNFLKAVSGSNNFSILGQTDHFLVCKYNFEFGGAATVYDLYGMSVVSYSKFEDKCLTEEDIKNSVLFYSPLDKEILISSFDSCVKGGSVYKVVLSDGSIIPLLEVPLDTVKIKKDGTKRSFHYHHDNTETLNSDFLSISDEDNFKKNCIENVYKKINNIDLYTSDVWDLFARPNWLDFSVDSTFDVTILGFNKLTKQTGVICLDKNTKTLKIKSDEMLNDFVVFDHVILSNNALFTSFPKEYSFKLNFNVHSNFVFARRHEHVLEVLIQENTLHILSNFTYEYMQIDLTSTKLVYSYQLASQGLDNEVISLHSITNTNAAICVQFLGSRTDSYWPGKLFILNTTTNEIVSKTDEFDCGILYVINNMEALNYNLNIVSIETGKIIRKLVTDYKNAQFKDMILTHNKQIVITKMLRPGLDRTGRIIRAFRISDGRLVFDYLFDHEPDLLLVSGNDRLLILIKDHPIQLYEIKENSQDPLLQINATSETKELIDDFEEKPPEYFEQIQNTLSKAFADVIIHRPDDPISHIAYFLLKTVENSSI